jgi:hypothetical protein
MSIASTGMFAATAVADFIDESLAKSLGDTVMAKLIDDVADLARAEWVALAKTQFSSARSRAEYIKGLQPVAFTDALQASIALVGVLPNLLENGQGPYDMHNTLLGDNVPVVALGSGQKGKHKNKKGGFYRAIPFRHGTPTSQGTAGAPMGSAYRGAAGVDASALGKMVYASARKLSATVGQPGTKVAYGGRLAAGMAPLLKPHHKTDIYAGMVRNSKTYEKATQTSGYMTFRTISTGSNGWQSKGVTGAGLLQRVEEFVRQQTPKLVAEYMKVTP